MQVIEKLEKINSEKIKKSFVALMKSYMHPAFGSMAKRDFDILLFMKLQELGVLDMNPELYDLVSDLRVTRSKARNLLYEAKLRATSKEELDSELIFLLKDPTFMKDNDKIALEIDNPYLIDHLRSHLRKLGHLTDGSFSQELIKLTPEAFIALFESYMPKESIDSVRETFIELGAVQDTTFRGVFKGVLKKLGNKVADEAGGAVAESLADYLGPVMSGAIGGIKDKFSEILSGN